jgi:glycosyltransferase involved in cell wall biosynthesis
MFDAEPKEFVVISVVIPVYNAAKYLTETIRSLQGQTFAEWELVMVNDGSQDDSLAIAEKFCRQDNRISVFSQENAGVSTARNFGLAKSSAIHPYVFFLDSDDLLVPNALQLLSSLLESHPEAPAVCGFLHDIDSEGCLIEGRGRLESLTQRRGIEGFRLVRREPDAPLVFGDLCFHSHIITTGQVLVRKSALKNTGGFDVSLPYAEDYHLWWRLVMQCGPIIVTPQPVLRYRHHHTSLSQNRSARRRGSADFHWRLLTHPGMSPDQQQVMRVGYFYRCWVKWEFAAFYLRRGEIKHGLKHAALGTRDMVYYVRDLIRLRRQAAVLARSVSR